MQPVRECRSLGQGVMPSKQKRPAPDPRFKETQQHVAEGITLQTYSDVMSERSTIRISLPLYGPLASSEDVTEALSLLGGAGYRETIDRCRSYLEGCTIADSAETEPLSIHAMALHSLRLLEEIEQARSELDPDYWSNMEKAVALAFRLGGQVAEMKLRERHLANIARHTKIASGWTSGGESRKGKLKASTEKILRFMDEQCAKGRKPREAALDAERKGHGTSLDANYRLYRRYRPSPP